MMNRILFFLIAAGLLTACVGAETTPDTTAIITTPTLLPTPTLVPALVTFQPTEETEAEAAGVSETAVSNSTLKITTAKATSTPTSTPSPTPSPTPQPAERIALGDTHLHNGDDAAAVAELEAALRLRHSLSAEQVQHVLYNLGVAYLHTGQASLAVDTFTELLGLTGGITGNSVPDAAYFYLGQAQSTLGSYQAAIGAYQSYLDANPDMTTYVNPYIAEAYFAIGDRTQGVAAYEAALSGSGYRLAQIELRQQLAEFYLADEDYAAAIEQYDAVRDLAVTELTKGQMTYLAGTAELLAGNSEAGYARYLSGVTSYPRAYESYLGLVALVDAEIPVDEFQRGLVDYYAAAYVPAITAFERYLVNNPDTYRSDTQLYLAWCYEAAGNLEAALAALDAYALHDAAAATIERAKLLARAGDGPAAITAYTAYLENFQDGPDAPFAAWWAAQWREWQGDISGAITAYQFLAQTFPGDADAPEALFRAGLLAEESGDRETAVSIWLTLSNTYPASEYSGATLVWLLRALAASPPTPLTPTRTASVPDGTPGVTATITSTPVVTGTAVLLAQVKNLALNNPGTGYYALRAQEIVRGGLPFTATDIDQLPGNRTILQVEAETWLRDWLGLTADTDVHTISPQLATDTRFVVGTKLWELGLFEAAKRELEALRQANGDNALFSYQLALYFRDIGLYRSSIAAAETVRALSGKTIFQVPRFIGQLIYPMYYADMILPLADEYGYDPLLQFALVRQESLFESFAHSGAAAQGLSQVIPDTGAYIAQQLDWPDYVNEDLYKPYVGLNFGAFYLAQQIDTFDQFVAAALASYNAGPGNAWRWYNQAGSDHDLYLESVDFTETHTYIKQIYVGYVMYQYLYGTH